MKLFKVTIAAPPMAGVVYILADSYTEAERMLSPSKDRIVKLEVVAGTHGHKTRLVQRA